MEITIDSYKFVFMISKWIWLNGTVMIAVNYRFIINFFFHLIPATKTCKKKKRNYFFQLQIFLNKILLWKYLSTTFIPFPKLIKGKENFSLFLDSSKFKTPYSTIIFDQKKRLLATLTWERKRKKKKTKKGKKFKVA